MQEVRIGTLIGAESWRDVGERMSEDDARSMDWVSMEKQWEHDYPHRTYSTFMYLVFNDSWTYHDNIGAIKVTVTVCLHRTKGNQKVTK